ncbi:MAG TPA: response regulator [Terriglobales bacterium]
MDTGTNQPESPNDANEPNQSSQSNQSGHSGQSAPAPNRFNRRRRRKGRKGQQAGGQQNARPNNAAQGQGQGNNRSRGQFDNRRNQQQNRRGGQGDTTRGRRGPGRGAAPFVGPMDHSYRNANGNMNGGMSNANGNANGRYRSNAFDQSNDAEFVPVAEDSRKIICFVEDLFFLAKIQEVARKLGAKVEFAKADKETIDRIVTEEEKPALIIFDLNNVNAKPLITIPKLKSKLKKGTSIVGFVSHIQGDLKLKAQEAGCDMVVPRSAFSQNLAGLLRRHSGGDQIASSEGM